MATADFTGTKAAKPIFGCSLVEPFDVCCDGVILSTHETADAASRACIDAHRLMMTPLELRRDRDERRTRGQAPIAARRYRVMYMQGKRERESAWFHTSGTAHRALEIIQARVGKKNAIIYVD